MLAEAFTSAGQAAEEPVQVSAVSQAPALALHCVLLEAKASVGHTGEVPSQVSAVAPRPG